MAGLSSDNTQELHLKQFCDSSGHIQRNRLELLLENQGPLINSLDLSGTNFQRLRGQADWVLQVLAERCPNTIVLTMEYFSLNQNTIGLILGFRRLETIAFKACAGLKDHHISVLLRECPTIKSLDVSSCQEVEMKFMETENHLASLTVLGCTQLVHLRKIKNLNLKTLITDKYTSKNIKFVLEASKNVENLIIKKPNITCLANLTNLKMLKTLVLIDTKLKTLTGFNDMCKNCKKLESIHLNSSTFKLNEEDSVIAEEQLLKLGELKELRTLKLHKLPFVSDVCLTYWADQLDKLMTLDINGCTKITDSGATRLLRKCAQLQVLNLSGCTKVTEATLRTAVSVAQNRQNNVTLHIQLTGTGIPASVMKNLPPSKLKFTWEDK